MRNNRGYGIIILMVVVAIITIWAVMIMGKKSETKKAITPSGIIETRNRANSAIQLEGNYNQELNSEVNN